MKKLIYLFIAVLVITACKKDDDDDDNIPATPTFEEKLVGTYAFVAGTFIEEITMYNVMAAGDTVVFSAGSDATQIVGGVLLGDSPCADPSNTALEMRVDYSLYYICIGESNEAQMGTWSADAANSGIWLNIPDPPISIPIVNVVIDDAGMTGSITMLPVPVDMSQPVGITNMQFANVAVVFDKLY